MREIASEQLVPGQLYYINKFYPANNRVEKYQGIYVETVITEIDGSRKKWYRFTNVKRFGHDSITVTTYLHTFYIPNGVGNTDISTMTEVPVNELVEGSEYIINRKPPRPEMYKGIYAGLAPTVGKQPDGYRFRNVEKISNFDFLAEIYGAQGAQNVYTFYKPEIKEIEERAMNRIYDEATARTLVDVVGDPHFDSGFGRPSHVPESPHPSIPRNGGRRTRRVKKSRRLKKLSKARKSRKSRKVRRARK